MARKAAAAEAGSNIFVCGKTIWPRWRMAALLVAHGSAGAEARRAAATIRLTLPERSPTVVLICPRAIFMRSFIVAASDSNFYFLPLVFGRSYRIVRFNLPEHVIVLLALDDVFQMHLAVFILQVDTPAGNLIDVGAVDGLL
jgi:hypothetical protein